LTIDAPSSVRVGEEFEVYLDLENNANKAYRIKKLELFDVGSFKLIKCEPELQNSFLILPHGVKTLTCRLRAEQAIRDRVEVQIAARVIYENNVSFVQDFDVVSFEEYQKRVKAKQWKELPKSFTKQSEEIKATIELSENPMIKRNLTETLSVKFSDIGNGLLTKINCTLSSLPPNLLYCPNCQPVGECTGENTVNCEELSEGKCKRNECCYWVGGCGGQNRETCNYFKKGDCKDDPCCEVVEPDPKHPDIWWCEPIDCSKLNQSACQQCEGCSWGGGCKRKSCSSLTEASCSKCGCKWEEKRKCTVHVKDKKSEPLTCLVNLSAINQSYLKVFTKFQLSYDYEIRKTSSILVVR